MKIPRALTVFVCSAGILVTLAILKALVVSGMDTLPPVRMLVFAGSMFGLVAALIDWGLLRDVFPRARRKPFAGHGPTPLRLETAAVSIPPRAQGSQNDALLERARQRPIVFRELCPPPAPRGLSFYGGVPVGPPSLAWPRARNKPGDAPLSFVMQWDSAELARQDVTGLLPRDGALYLFADLTWGEPFDFQFVQVKGPSHGWTALPAPDGLPPIYGEEGPYMVPYCSPRVAKELQDVPRLLPKWPFLSTAFSYPAVPEDAGAHSEDAQAELYWNDGERVAEALLLLEHPQGVPAAKRRDREHARFARPFATFPHDYAAVRVAAAKILERLRRPESLLRNAGEIHRQATLEQWRNDAAEHYALAATHPPGTRVEPSRSDEIWYWMEQLEELLAPGWSSLVDECVNVSFGLNSEAASALPPDLVELCSENHRLAASYLHDEYPDHSTPEARASWEARKELGALKEVRSLHAPCPNHMFGPPSYVQGSVEEYLEEWLLLLELSSRRPIGHEFGEGVLQFLIRPSDLRDGRFDQVKLVASAY